MILFTLKKKDLQQALKQLRTMIKTRKYNVYVQAVFLIEPGRLTICLSGIETYCRIENEGVGMFEMYFMDFFEAIENDIAPIYDDLNFILDKTTIQFGKRKMSVLKTEFDTDKVKEIVEAPLGTLNYDINEDKKYYTSYFSKVYCLKKDINTHFNQSDIEKDVDMFTKFLKKYQIERHEISDFLYAKMYEKDPSKLF